MLIFIAKVAVALLVSCADFCLAIVVVAAFSTIFLKSPLSEQAKSIMGYIAVYAAGIAFAVTLFVI